MRPTLAALAAGVTVYLAIGVLLGVYPFRTNGAASGARLQNPVRRYASVVRPLVSVFAVSAVAGSAVGVGAGLWSGSVAIGLACGCFASVAPSIRMLRHRTRLSRAAARAWPDALRFLASTVRSGGTLLGGLGAMASDGPLPLRPVFSTYRVLAASLGADVALEVVRRELADPMSDRVIEVLIAALERGGPIIPELLNEVALATSEDLHVAAEIDTNSYEERLNSRMVIAIPWGLLLLLTWSEGAFRAFYRTSAGALVIGVAAALSVGGVAAMAMLNRTEREQRVLEPGGLEA